MMMGWNMMTPDDEERLLRGVVHGGVHGGPWAVEIQPTNACNVDCFFCSSKFHRHDEALPWDDVLLPFLRDAAARDLKSIRLSGGGESLIYPKIRPLLQFLQQHNIRIADLTTNAAPLAKLADHIVDVGLDLASISINEITPDAYARTMQTNERLFDRVVEGIRALRTAADRLPPDKRPKVELKFMVWRENFRQAPHMVQFAREVGADRVHLNNIIGLPPQKRLTPAERAEALPILQALLETDLQSHRPILDLWMDDEPEIQSMVWQTRERLLQNSTPPPDRHARTEYCLMGWYSMTIAATGKVYPCCNFVGLPNKIVGNIHQQTIHQIWNGPEYEAFRLEFRRLMILRGEMEHSRKYDRFVEPYCIQHRACPWGWCLARPETYQKLAQRIERDITPAQRLEATARNLLLKSAHTVTALTRSTP